MANVTISKSGNKVTINFNAATGKKLTAASFHVENIEVDQSLDDKHCRLLTPLNTWVFCVAADAQTGALVVDTIDNGGGGGAEAPLDNADLFVKLTALE